jgi:hypothetical protein
MNITEGPSTSAGLAGIQQMLLSGAPHMALRHELFEGKWANRTKWVIRLAEAVLSDLQPSLGFAGKQSPSPGRRGTLPKLRPVRAGHGLLEGLN